MNTSQLMLTHPVPKVIEGTVVDIIRYLASYTATGNQIEISKARRLALDLARHEVCGSGVDGKCKLRCAEIASPLWDVSLYIHRSISRVGR